MAKKQIQNFVCNNCGYESIQWYGKCPNCGEWNTMVEFKQAAVKPGGIKSSANKPSAGAIRIGDVEKKQFVRKSTGIEELDRVLGGGFVPGSVSLLAGEPGVGKSTLLLELAKKMGKKDTSRIVYVTGEESPEQVAMRAERVETKNDNLLLFPETNVERIGEMVQPGDLLIIDSIQTIWSEEIEGYQGSVSQLKGCTQKVIEIAKSNSVSVILVGHITKEGEIAGPMMLTHMVDGVFFLEGERFNDLRLLRGIKNRFGPTDEVGVFRMSDKGMSEVTNPSEVSLEESGAGVQPGSVVICAMEGTRPVMVEVQALVTKSFLAMPRRVGMGVDNNRLNLLTAVIQKKLRLPLWEQDIFVKVAGGLKVNEPAADLGICLAIISSFKNQPVPLKTAVFGEVGLLGEVRRVNNEEKRDKEAKKLGFEKVLSSKSIKSLDQIVKQLKVPDGVGEETSPESY